ncbi:MAG: DUF2974 domain-containing protein [Coriobacteriia bacterium]|nr:DUF2974 domain-containing protein [Coriobacteriia bacterium]
MEEPNRAHNSAYELMCYGSLPALIPPEPPARPEERTMTDYLRFQQASFEEIPFNPVDSLILSSLVYLDYELVDFAPVHRADPIPIIDVLRFCDFDELIARCWMKNCDDISEFFNAFARNRRFAKLCVCLYANEQSENIDKQFSAITFVAPGMGTYVAFSGTDGSVVGWKEDFALSYKDVIPSQRSAQAYLSGVASCFTEGVLLVGGHSKGGNLAEFAAATIHKDVYERVGAIFNHDGPNFLNPPSPRYLSTEYQGKRHKYVPESSIFGMILEDSTHLRYVASNAVSFFQHRPVTWLVKDDDFQYCDDQSQSAQFFDEALDAWLRSCTTEQRDAFLGAIFELVEETDCHTFAEFQRKLPQNLAKVLRGTRNLDKQTRDALTQTFSHLGRVLKMMTAERLQGAVGRLLPGVGQ